MDLKNGNITVGELLQNEKARSLFGRISPISMNSPIIKSNRNMTLNQLVRRAKRWMPQKKIDQIIEELQTY